MSRLISGKEALMALANGEDIQYRFPDQIWLDFTNNMNESGSKLRVVDLLGDYASFRLKPKTITVTLELPKPFKPELWDKYWYISPHRRPQVPEEPTYFLVAVKIYLNK